MRWLKGKRLFWTRYIRIFTDGGYPKFRYFPRFRRLHYAVHWGMWGFAMYLFGREFNFSFGIDKNKLYKKGKKMRDPDHIDEILKLISEIWHKNPNLRLCQLLGNCFTHGGLKQKDLYYVEDDMLQDRLEKKYL